MANYNDTFKNNLAQSVGKAMGGPSSTFLQQKKQKLKELVGKSQKPVSKVLPGGISGSMPVPNAITKGKMPPKQLPAKPFSGKTIKI